MEKPIDVSLEAADRLIDAARAAGVALTVISQHRFDPGLIELKRLLDEQALGRLVLGEASTKWYRTQAYYDSAAWRGTYAMDGGSLMNQGVHYVDLLRWCMGPPAEVTAVCTTQAHQIEVEDTALAIVRFASGAVGTILSSTAAFPGFPQRLEITGTEGTVTVEDGQIVRRALAADPGPAAPARCRRRRPFGGRRPGGAGCGQPRRAARRPAGRGRYRARARGQRPGRPRRAGDRPRRVRVVPHRPAGDPGPMTVILSGFADEISPDPQAQLATLAAESISHLELRSAWSVNVADFTGEQLAAFRAAVDAAGVRVSAIGSPIGKIPVDAPFGPELDRMRRVADVAAELGTTIVRVFSFFMPAGEPPERYRGQVIDRMGALARIAEERGLILAHENEKEIYGDVPDRCADLITAVGSPALRATFDPANFVQCGVRPFSDAYALTPALPGLPAGQGRAGRDRRGRAGRAGRRGAARDAGRAAGLGLRGLHVARTAPGAGWALRRLQRPGGLRSRRFGAEIFAERSIDPLAVTRACSPWSWAQTVPVSPQRRRMARSATLNSVWTMMPRIRITMMIEVAPCMSA